jgi:hypothetical protein
MAKVKDLVEFLRSVDQELSVLVWWEDTIHEMKPEFFAIEEHNGEMVLLLDAEAGRI